MGLLDGAVSRRKNIIIGILRKVDNHFPLSSEDLVLTAEHASLLGYNDRREEIYHIFKGRIKESDISESLDYILNK